MRVPRDVWMAPPPRSGARRVRELYSNSNTYRIGRSSRTEGRGVQRHGGVAGNKSKRGAGGGLKLFLTVTHKTPRYTLKPYSITASANALPLDFLTVDRGTVRLYLQGSVPCI